MVTAKHVLSSLLGDAMSVHVQSGQFQQGDVSELVTIDPVNLDETFLMFSFFLTGGGSVFRDAFVRGHFISDSEIEFRRDRDQGAMAVSWFVVSIDNAKVQSFTGDLDGTTTDDISIDEVDPEKTFLVHSVETDMQDNTARLGGFSTSRLTSPTSARVQISFDGFRHTYTLFVVEAP